MTERPWPTVSRPCPGHGSDSVSRVPLGDTDTLTLSDHGVPGTQSQLLLDALTRNLIGKPAILCDWRELVRVRDCVDQLVNDELNRRQNPTPTDAA